MATLSDGDPVVLLWLAHAKAVTGARTEAISLVTRARALGNERYVPAYHLALAYTGLENIEAACAALDQAWLDRDPALASITVEPRFDRLRREPRFCELIAKLGLSLAGSR